MLFGYFFIYTTFNLLYGGYILAATKVSSIPITSALIANCAFSVYVTYVVGSIMNESENSKEGSYAKVSNVQMAW